MQKSSARVLIELKARAGAAFKVELFDGIVQTAGCPHDRHSSIAQAVDLVEAAGLVARRHQEHIRTRFDEVSQPVIVGDDGTDATRKILRKRPEQSLVLALPRPKNGQ